MLDIQLHRTSCNTLSTFEWGIPILSKCNAVNNLPMLFKALDIKEQVKLIIRIPGILDMLRKSTMLLIRSNIYLSAAFESSKGGQQAPCFLFHLWMTWRSSQPLEEA